MGLVWDFEEATALAAIGGHLSHIHLSPPLSSFADVNVLGTDFCELHHASMLHDFRRRRTNLYIGGTWKVEADEVMQQPDEVVREVASQASGRIGGV